MRRKRTGRSIWLLIAAFGAAVALGIGLLVRGLRPPLQQLPDGSMLTLVSVTYGSRHQLVEGQWWQKLFASILPPHLQPRANRWTSIYTADHPKTLVLWTHQQKMSPASHWNQEGVWETRVVASDEHGCRSETGSLAASAGLNWPSTEVYAAWALPAFPRRGRSVHAQIEERQRGSSEWTPVAHFVVSNPDPGPHPQWQTLPLPLTRQAGDLAVTLAALETGVRPPDARVAAPEEGWSQATFRLAQNGRPTVAWQPASLTLSDAAGDRWTPHTEAVFIEGDQQQFPFRSLLWPDEAAWKLLVRFEQKAGFAPDQLWTTAPLRLPARRKVHRVDTEVTRQGARLRLLAVSGPAAAVWDGYGWNAALPILHTRLSPTSSDLRVSLLRAVDDQGRVVPLSQSLYGGSGKYSFVLEPAPSAKQIQATLALHRPLFAEFTARATPPHGTRAAG